MMAAVVAAMTLGELLGPAAGPLAGLSVTDLASDSREVTPGSAFVALPGERAHGLDFAAQATAAGAAVVLYESHDSPPSLSVPGIEIPGLRARLGELGRRFYGRGRRLDELVGVTGTNGKTTVAWLVAEASTGLGAPCGYIGTLGFGFPGALEPQALTTPDCLTLHRELAGIDASRAALEVSSHALAQDRIAGLDVSVAAFTNLSREHLDWHGTMEAYFESKSRLFEARNLRAAVINCADEWGRAMLGRLASTTRPVTVAMAEDAGAAIMGKAKSRGLGGIELEVGGSLGRTEFRSPLVGAFNAENLLVALGVLVACGHDIEAAGTALGLAPPPPGRMEAFGGPPESPWVIVDYAHTPDALERVLAELRSITEGEITCVFGCGGERDRGKRSPMGEIAARYAAHVILTDDNPRGEDPADIVADIKAGIVRHPDLRIEHVRERAIAEAVAGASAGDVVLVAGKGHETQQLVAGESRPFDDRAVVRSVLEGIS
jgi:UDP-N-acetylmuramoyl-L-alanyl-D-glutamate--2,6-diaminopimelate ligase